MKSANYRGRMLGERPGLCDCTQAVPGTNSWGRTCMKCRRWMGPAFYPAWWGDGTVARHPRRVRVSPHRPKGERRLRLRLVTPKHRRAVGR